MSNWSLLVSARSARNPENSDTACAACLRGRPPAQSVARERPTVQRAQSLRATLTLQDISALVVNLLADVPGSMCDFKSPAKMHSKAVGELHAVLEMPQTPCKSMRPLSHSVVH